MKRKVNEVKVGLRECDVKWLSSGGPDQKSVSNVPDESKECGVDPRRQLKPTTHNPGQMRKASEYVTHFPCTISLQLKNAA